MRKLYGQFGYIDFVPEPNFDIVPNTDQIDLTMTADEGKQFFIRRIDFSGNTTTRDKVIRREILLDEGDMFNTQLWDLSILRLNQLGYFEMLKKEDAADIKRNPQTEHRRHHAKVKERGKNSIGLNGGVSGIAGSFMGFNYSTNNFLGLGETLSIDSQLGTRMRNVSFGFTEPYFLDRPMQLGFVVYLRALQFRPGPRGVDSGRPEPDPAVQPAGHAEPAELHPEQPRLLRLGQLSAAPQLRARRHHLRLRHFQHQDRDHRAPTIISSTSISAASPARTRSRASAPATSRRRTPTTPSTTRSARPAAAASSSPSDFAGSVLGGNVNTIRATRGRQVLQAGALAQEPHPGVPRHGVDDHRLRRQVRAAVTRARSWAASRISAASKSGASRRSRSSRRRRTRQCAERRRHARAPRRSSAAARSSTRRSR